MIMNRLTITWYNNLLIVVFLLCFATCFDDSDWCSHRIGTDRYDARCDCLTKQASCTIGGVTVDSSFWNEFSHISPISTLEIVIYSPEESAVQYFPTQLFPNLPSSIEEITLSSWKFTMIPPFKVAVTSRVKTLTIQDTDAFTTIGPNAFAPLSIYLERLLLISNGLSDIDRDAFRGLKNLSEVNLVSNKLISLPDNLFTDATKLVNLTLTSNSIVTLRQSVFHGLTSLQELELNNNKLISLKNDTFLELSHLRTLDLSHNQINFLEPLAFHGLISVEFIDLSDNQLRALPSGLLSYTLKLTDIDLKHNHLTSLSDDFLKQLPKTAFLKNNQWICDCNLLYHSETLLTINSEVNCTTSSDEFNEKGKPAKLLEMSFKQYIDHIKENPKRCIYSTLNYKEKRSHLNMASAGKQTGSSCSLSSPNIFATLTLSMLMAMTLTP